MTIVGVRDRGESKEAIHGRLDIHLHRTGLGLRQSFQADEVLHAEGGGHVPGSGEDSFGTI